MRILMIEDEALLRESIANALRQEGYAVDEAGTCEDARWWMQEHPYDLVILDLGLPDGDGLTLLTSWRRRGHAMPVLILTARDAVESRIKGLESGGDDYLVKPFHLPELIARVRALGRRAGTMKDVILRVDDLELNQARAEVRRAGVLLPLRAKEFAVLLTLMRRRGRVLSREQLETACWDEIPGSNVVEATLSTLRRKLGDPPIIETRRGLGYIVDG